MTEKEAAALIVTETDYCCDEGGEEYPFPSVDQETTARNIAAAIRAAVAAEREACADLCEKLRGEGMMPAAGCLECAAAIRARGAKESMVQ